MYLNIVLMHLFTNCTLLHCRNSSLGQKKWESPLYLSCKVIKFNVKFHKKLLQFQENAAGPQLAIFTMKCICRERQRFSLKFYNGPKLLLIEKKKYFFQSKATGVHGNVLEKQAFLKVKLIVVVHFYYF